MIAAMETVEYVRPLTRRHRETVDLAAKGYTNAEIAQALGIAKGTVKNHLSGAYARLGARNRAQAVERRPRPGGLGQSAD